MIRYELKCLYGKRPCLIVLIKRGGGLISALYGDVDNDEGFGLRLQPE